MNGLTEKLNNDQFREFVRILNSGDCFVPYVMISYGGSYNLSTLIGRLEELRNSHTNFGVNVALVQGSLRKQLTSISNTRMPEDQESLSLLYKALFNSENVGRVRSYILAPFEDLF